MGGGGGGRLFEEGRLLQILNLRRGANSKRGAYLKLGANSSIYGYFLTILRKCSYLWPDFLTQVKAITTARFGHAPTQMRDSHVT